MCYVKIFTILYNRTILYILTILDILYNLYYCTIFDYINIIKTIYYKGGFIVDRLARWHIQEFLYKRSSKYENQPPATIREIAYGLNKNPNTVKAIARSLRKWGYLEAVKFDRPLDDNTRLKKNLGFAKKVGRKRLGFILSQRRLDYLKRFEYVDENNVVRIRIPVSTFDTNQVLELLKRARDGKLNYKKFGL